jgi:hypothetical protein
MEQSGADWLSVSGILKKQGWSEQLESARQSSRSLEALLHGGPSSHETLSEAPWMSQLAVALYSLGMDAETRLYVAF